MIKLLFASKAFMAIVPMQDVLCLGVESRMNFPSTVSPDNWSYRFKKSDFSSQTAAWLCEQSKKNKR
jgi:4-alpha-glucanotransferase